MKKVRWEEMFPDELEKAFLECPVLYLPYGMCEPHGPHNAIGLDALKAHAIACRSAEVNGGIVAPPDFWHIHEVGGYAAWAYQSIGEVPRHWMTSLPPWQHFKNVCYHIRTADALGFQATFLLTGHYGPNWQDLNTLVSILQPLVGTRLYSLPEFESNYKGYSGDGRETGDHAGKVETSLLWALRPELVDVSRIPQGPDAGHPYAMGGDVACSNRQIGERMVADEIEWFGRKMQELLADYHRLKPEHNLTTFAAVEKAWKELVEPRLVDFKTMQHDWERREDVPASSVWYKNRTW